MKSYLGYDIASGEIVITIFSSDDGPLINLHENIGIMSGIAMADIEYVDVHVIPPRIRQKLRIDAILQGAGVENVSITLSADGNSVARITSIPPGTTVMVNGPVTARDLVNDGDYELTVDYPGDYTIRLTHPIRLPQEFVVHAT